MYAFSGRTLHVDLSAKSYETVERDELFYRTHLGGALLAARLFEHELAGGVIDGPYAANNPLVFATGPLADEKICGAPRVNILTLSPETTGTYVSQAGGDFGPGMKRAGFDAMVITGQSTSPLHLKITGDGKRVVCDFVDASHLWTKSGHRVHDVFGQSSGEHTICCIGPAGEKRVACANVMFEVDHYAGRGGLGAVMGAKKLKVISLEGSSAPRFKNRARMVAISKAAAARFNKVGEDEFLGVLRKLGTYGLMDLNRFAGNLPTRNFERAIVESETFRDQIDHTQAKEHTIGKSNPCRACFVACKKTYRKDSPHADKRSTAEYESLALLGPNIGLTEDLTAGIEACELCNQLGVDTMSIGNTIAWLMDCFEKGVLRQEDVGFSLQFGDGEAALRLIGDIGLRRTELGNLLADGLLAAVEQLGEATRPYLRASRGIGLPAHMPRVKPGVGFGYLHGPNPGDHMKLEHDWIAADAGMIEAFGLEKDSAVDALDAAKVEMAQQTQTYYAMADVLSVCMFVFGPGNVFTFEEITELANEATGFAYSFDDLMRLGHESVQLQRQLYVATGGRDEEFLSYLGTEIPDGPSKGRKITKADFDTAREHYLSLWGWDAQQR